MIARFCILETINLRFATSISMHTSRLQFHSLESAIVPVFVTDLRGNILEWNKEASRSSGISREDIVGTSLFDHVAPTQRDLVRERFGRAFAGTRELSGFRISFGGDASEAVDFEVNASPWSGDSPDLSVTGLLVIATNITAQKAVLSDCRKTTGQACSGKFDADLHEFVDSSFAAIFGVDAKGVLSDWNMMMAKVTGLSSNDVLGKDLISIITYDSQDSLRQVLENALLGKGTMMSEVRVDTCVCVCARAYVRVRVCVCVCV